MVSSHSSHIRCHRQAQVGSYFLLLSHGGRSMSWTASFPVLAQASSFSREVNARDMASPTREHVQDAIRWKEDIVQVRMGDVFNVPPALGPVHRVLGRRTSAAPRTHLLPQAVRAPCSPGGATSARQGAGPRAGGADSGRRTTQPGDGGG